MLEMIRKVHRTVQREGCEKDRAVWLEERQGQNRGEYQSGKIEIEMFCHCHSANGNQREHGNNLSRIIKNEQSPE